MSTPPRVRQQSLAFLNILDQIQKFDPESEGNPAAVKESLVNSIGSFYETLFDNLHDVVAFIAARKQDFSALELEARSAAQAARQEADELREQMRERQAEAERALAEIRKVAAEQGVSQQAYYFKNEADRQENQAIKWQRNTIFTSIGLGSYSILTLIFSILYTPKNDYAAVQIGLSKILIFAVIAYMLFLCARTLMAYRHNSVINRHRENALLTFNALVESAGSDEKRDIILTHAAGCIFSPQDTGYTKFNGGPQFSSASIIEALPRIAHSV